MAKAAVRFVSMFMMGMTLLYLVVEPASIESFSVCGAILVLCGLGIKPAFGRPATSEGTKATG